MLQIKDERASLSADCAIVPIVSTAVNFCRRNIFRKIGINLETHGHSGSHVVSSAESEIIDLTALTYMNAL